MIRKLKAPIEIDLTEDLGEPSTLVVGRVPPRVSRKWSRRLLRARDESDELVAKERERFSERPDDVCHLEGYTTEETEDAFFDLSKEALGACFDTLDVGTESYTDLAKAEEILDLAGCLTTLIFRLLTAQSVTEEEKKASSS